jgi:hypothetical protein
MKRSKKISNIFKWIFKGGLVSVPLVFSSTLALSEQLTWAGAVLLWFYTGRILRQRDESKTEQHL